MTAKRIVCRRTLLHRDANKRHPVVSKTHLPSVNFVAVEVMKEALLILLLLLLLLLCSNQTMPGC